MIQPDKWDEVAKSVLPARGERVDIADTPERYEAKVAQALRDAEKAGMERAAVIAEAMECEWANDRDDAIHGYPVGPLISPSDAIRAAKETKE
jgi:hypothetical protein